MDNKINVTIQGIGDVSRHLNQLRADELLKNLRVQDVNLENALNELKQVREFYAAPEHIKGSMATKHGELAEHIQVRFENADKLIVGEQPTHTFEGVGRNAPVDYLKNGQPVQSKFKQTSLSIDAIKEHLKKYPDFIANGGNYDIPKDYYEQIEKWLKLSPEELKNRGVARKVVEKVREFEKANNVKFEDVVHPTQASYDEVQLGKVDQTIDTKEQEINEADKDERQKYNAKAKASLKEGIVAAGISAIIDGVLSFGTSFFRKINQKKNLSDFDEEDWLDIFKNTGIGVIRGGAFGGGIYALINIADMSAPLAACLVSSTIGTVSQAIKLAKGNISVDDFFYNIPELAVNTAVSGIGAVVGQTAIPIPVAGAMAGAIVSTTVLGVIKDKVFDGEYYVLLDNAKYEYSVSSTYITLVDALEKSQERFEKAVTLFSQYMNEISNNMMKSIQNQQDLENLSESI